MNEERSNSGVDGGQLPSDVQLGVRVLDPQVHIRWLDQVVEAEESVVHIFHRDLDLDGILQQLACPVLRPQTNPHAQGTEAGLEEGLVHREARVKTEVSQLSLQPLAGKVEMIVDLEG